MTDSLNEIKTALKAMQEIHRDFLLVVTSMDLDEKLMLLDCIAQQHRIIDDALGKIGN